MRSRTIGCLAVCFLLASGLADQRALAQAAAESPYYSRVNTFGILAAYSNDSSHMLLGASENRKLLDFGVIYSRRIAENRVVNWQYNAELLPVALESDPVQTISITQLSPTPAQPYAPTTSMPITPCHAASGSNSNTFEGVVYAYDFAITCSRRWTIGEGMSPAGFQWNFRPRHKLQPIIVAHGGYMYSTRPIPEDGAGSFNFTFDLGAGFELYRSRTRSVRFDYRYHHISDDNTSGANPGIDNGLFTVTYSFGR